MNGMSDLRAVDLVFLLIPCNTFLSLYLPNSQPNTHQAYSSQNRKRVFRAANTSMNGTVISPRINFTNTQRLIHTRGKARYQTAHEVLKSTGKNFVRHDLGCIVNYLIISIGSCTQYISIRNILSIAPWPSIHQ